MSCHGYEGVMLVFCTPLQVQCYPLGFSVHSDTHETSGASPGYRRAHKGGV